MDTHGYVWYIQDTIDSTVAQGGSSKVTIPIPADAQGAPPKVLRGQYSATGAVELFSTYYFGFPSATAYGSMTIAVADTGVLEDSTVATEHAATSTNIGLWCNDLQSEFQSETWKVSTHAGTAIADTAGFGGGFPDTTATANTVTGYFGPLFSVFGINTYGMSGNCDDTVVRYMVVFTKLEQLK